MPASESVARRAQGRLPGVAASAARGRAATYARAAPVRAKCRGHPSSPASYKKNKSETRCGLDAAHRAALARSPRSSEDRVRAHLCRSPAQALPMWPRAILREEPWLPAPARARQFSIGGCAFILPQPLAPERSRPRQFVHDGFASPNTCAGPLRPATLPRRIHLRDKTPFLRSTI